jgi:hypothetical protein
MTDFSAGTFPPWFRNDTYSDKVGRALRSVVTAWAHPWSTRSTPGTQPHKAPLRFRAGVASVCGSARSRASRACTTRRRACGVAPPRPTTPAHPRSSCASLGLSDPIHRRDPAFVYFACVLCLRHSFFGRTRLAGRGSRFCPQPSTGAAQVAQAAGWGSTGTQAGTSRGPALGKSPPALQA